jgi:excisionase family DNA binding protein
MKNSPSPAVGGDLMSVAEVARQIEVHPKTVYAWTYRKTPLPVHREGRRVFIAGEDLDAFLIANLPKSPSPAQETGIAKDDTPSTPVDESASPVEDAATPLIEKRTDGCQRELGQARNVGFPEMALIACLQLM